MKRYLYLFVLLFFFIGICTSCEDNLKDDDSLGYMEVLTIKKDGKGDYYCFSHDYGVVISNTPGLDTVNKAYCSVNFMKNDRGINADGKLLIKNARVYVDKDMSINDPIYPINKEKSIKNPKEGSKQKLVDDLTIYPAMHGYIDIEGDFSAKNTENNKVVDAKVNLVYDMDELLPDTLKFKLYSNFENVEDWEEMELNEKKITVDISSLATLKNWSDSLTIIVSYDESTSDFTKISKKDFLKPQIKDVNLDIVKIIR